VERNYQARKVPFQAQLAGLAASLPRTARLQKHGCVPALGVRPERRKTHDSAIRLWHVLCLAKRDGFMPVMNEESVWQLLQGAAYTTPLLREWTH
jgi:hypothetical protein